MNLLLALIVAIIIVGVLLWAAHTILAVVKIAEPFKTIIWVLVVVVALIVFLQMSGLYHFDWIR
jgi:hypothetical protein